MKPPAKDEPPAEQGDGVTEHTHAELHLLYGESMGARVFAKAQQWKTVGATLLVHVVLIVIARIVPADSGLAYYFALLIFVITPGAIFVLLVYQLWQHTEKQKMDAIARRFSETAREFRAMKSTREANFHRYALFFCMAVLVVLGGWVTNAAINSLSP